MFHHIVLFRFKEDVSPETIADLRSHILSLRNTIDTIHHLSVGRDAGLSDGNWDLVVVAAFADIDGYRTYRDHPEHLPVIERLRTLTVARAAVQSTEVG